VLTGTQDNDEIIERVAALDIGQADLVCCVRVPDEGRPGWHGKTGNIRTAP
jgi:transposase